MKMTFTTVVCVILALIDVSFAQDITPYKVALNYPSSTSPSDQSTISIQVPYSLGTHEGHIGSVEGLVLIENSGTVIKGFSLEVPLKAIDMGKSKMNCHTREALGLNYQTSSFPKSHVCNSKDELPDTGSDAIAYPTVTFKSKGQSILALDKPIALPGTLSIHGQSKEVVLTLKLSKQNDQWRVTGEHTVNLSDFGVEVKPFLLIKVKGIVKLKFDLLLQQAT
ncbi:MAG: YceI family protein [Bdellovibrionales bacterium]|nr:YceI family protein [Bdellovibrionales bacterium]